MVNKKEGKKIKGKIISNTITCILVTVVLSGIGVGAVTLFASSEVIYDNSNSGATSTDVQGAIDELYELAENPPYYDPYDIGTTVYYNPVEGTKCFDYVSANSLNNNKTGCMRWYIIGKTGTTIDMILDHNTTKQVHWNKSGSNSSGPGTASSGSTNENLLYQLKSDTSGWTGVTTRTDSYTDPAYSYTINYNGYKARLIEASEVAKITGADKALQWDSATLSSSLNYYLDGKYGTDSTWRTQVAESQGASKYAWLYDYTEGCTSYGCNIADSSGEKGYWTSSAVSGFHYAWYVNYFGYVTYEPVGNYGYGVRPVITIPKP